MLGLHVRQQRRFKATHLCNFNVIQVIFVGGVQQYTHLRNGEGCVLFLLHEFGDPLAVIELGFGRIIKVRGKLGKGRELAILGKGGTDASGQLLHDLGLGGTTDTGY